MPLEPDQRSTVVRRIAIHAIGAGAFFFVIQRFVLNESLATSLVWASFFCLAAGCLAWSQSRR